MNLSGNYITEIMRKLQLAKVPDELLRKTLYYLRPWKIACNSSRCAGFETRLLIPRHVSEVNSYLCRFVPADRLHKYPLDLLNFLKRFSPASGIGDEEAWLGIAGNRPRLISEVVFSLRTNITSMY